MVSCLGLGAQTRTDTNCLVPGAQRKQFNDGFAYQLVRQTLAEESQFGLYRAGARRLLFEFNVLTFANSHLAADGCLLHNMCWIYKQCMVGHWRRPGELHIVKLHLLELTWMK